MICGLWRKNKTEIILLRNATRSSVNLANLKPYPSLENKFRITGYKIRVSFAGSPHKRLFIR